ncbi:MAG: 3-phosphoshikimate 1-carboxyvinyltransferase [Bacteroidota bacterium]|jgi:3-phosphoshikimate 1-carboxyvinyltransferase
MKVTVYPSVIQGAVEVPRSKSIGQRVLACALMANGETIIDGLPDSDDCQHALEVIRQLGAVVRNDNGKLLVRGGYPFNFQADIRMPKDRLSVGESGLAARMFGPIISLWHDEIEMEGSGTLTKRSMKTMEEWLSQLDVKIALKNDLLPARIQGPMTGGKIISSFIHSSQFVTGMLLAGAVSKKGIELELENVPSKGYVDTTMAVAKAFGVNIQETPTGYWVEGGQKYQAREISVDGDWSGAAFLFVAAALSAENGLWIKGLSTEIPQADQAILEVLTMARVRVEKTEEGYCVYQSKIKCFDFDANDCPDLFPILATLAVFGDGPSTIKGVNRLADKESNRAKAIQHEWAKMGVNTVIRGDELKIYPKMIKTAHVHAHHDHRMAMALTVMGLAGAALTIHTAESVSKSFPNFYEVIKAIGGRLD